MVEKGEKFEYSKWQAKKWDTDVATISLCRFLLVALTKHSAVPWIFSTDTICLHADRYIHACSYADMHACRQINKDAYDKQQTHQDMSYLIPNCHKIECNYNGVKTKSDVTKH